jgi:hypothetical protein
MADTTPYGDVTYADPGYQADKVKRYPLDSEAHCRAAWSYINMPKNAAKYTSSQVASIKSRIKAAGKKYGITFSDEKAVAAADLLGVEIARPGAWRLASGDLTVTAEMLNDAARYAQRPGARPSPVKLGHSDPRFSGDGEPALGWLANLRVEDDNGPVLVGDITGMPDWLAAAAPDHWPDRSMEGWSDFEADDGETYGLVVDGLAMLGVTPPGMSSIRSLRDLPQALGVAASARIVARAPQAPAVAAEVPTDKKEAGQMDPAKIREALGLPADASDDEVKASLVTAGLGTAAPPDTKVTVQPPLPGLAPEPEPAPEPKRHLVNAAGLVQMDPSMVEQTNERIKRLEAKVAKHDRDERDQVLTQAVVEGKFAPFRKDHWARLWDADPEGTRQVIDSLSRNIIPVMASGYAETDADIDAEYASLFPPSGKGV